MIFFKRFLFLLFLNSCYKCTIHVNIYVEQLTKYNSTHTGYEGCLVHEYCLRYGIFTH